MAYYPGVVNHQQPLIKGGLGDEVDRVLLEMGVPLQQPGLDWSFDTVEKNESIAYAPVDDETRQTLKELQALWIQAHKHHDFEKLASIGKDIKTLLHVGSEILRLKRALQECVRTENFSQAIEIRNDILKHQNKREAFEILYETSRFEESLLVGDPSAAFKETLAIIDAEEYGQKERVERGQKLESLRELERRS